MGSTRTLTALELCAVSHSNGCVVEHIDGNALQNPSRTQVDGARLEASHGSLGSADIEPSTALRLPSLLGDALLEEEIFPETTKGVTQARVAGAGGRKGGRISHNSRALIGGKRKLLEELFDRSNGGRLGKKRGDEKSHRKKKGTKKSASDSIMSKEISGASVSDAGISNRNR
ncbi:hypothetical protein L1049_020634 [Liquidambar formosana]|uniref:Uncharacterized protein n=1 Tax=Liquidambar formosana TaxID=63359 RepID=A0AAP0X7I1_LIQFO